MASKSLIYTLLVVLLCLAATARIGFVMWQKHEDHKAVQTGAQRKLDLVKQYSSQNAPKARMKDQHPCVYFSVEPKTEEPAVGDCGMSTSLFTDPVDRFEVDLRYGNFVVRQTDLFLNDDFAVPLTRVYTSLDWFEPNHVHAFGKNTNHTYDIAPLGMKYPYSWLAIALEDSDFLSFDRVSQGTGWADAVFRHTETDGRFYKAITYWNDKGWTTKLTDGSSITFPVAYKPQKIADGAPIEIQDAKGNRLQLIRDADHKIEEIHTSKGHLMRFTYNDQGWIMRAEDDLGHWVVYLYNSDGMLVTVLYSSGKKRLYDYDGTNLTAISDEEDRVLVHNTYENERIVSQEFPDGKVYEYSYQWSKNGQYVESATLRLPDGAWQAVETGAFVPNYVKRAQEQVQANSSSAGQTE